MCSYVPRIRVNIVFRLAAKCSLIQDCFIGVLNPIETTVLPVS